MERLPHRVLVNGWVDGRRVKAGAVVMLTRRQGEAEARFGLVARIEGKAKPKRRRRAK